MTVVTKLYISVCIASKKVINFNLSVFKVELYTFVYKVYLSVCLNVFITYYTCFKYYLLIYLSPAIGTRK